MNNARKLEESEQNGRDDRIFLSTRIVAALVVPFLILAFLILFLQPESSGERFAWEIGPSMTAAYMGAGYLGGSWLFISTLFGRRWHRVAPGFLPVTTFTIFMLLATILHWERFDLQHVPFLLWLGLYVVTPLLVPLLWWRNQRSDPGIPEPGDREAPLIARMSLRILGVLLLAFAVIGFVLPQILIEIWPWALSILTARIMCGWIALLGVGGIVIGAQTRWSAWKVGLQSIGLWHFLVLLAAAGHSEDFTAGLLNWYLVSVVLVLLGMVTLYLAMQFSGEKRPATP